MIGKARRLRVAINNKSRWIVMEDNDHELEGDGLADDNGDASESDNENDAIIHEKDEPSSPRDNI